jgi:chaperone required for assembly of F1-ATPase
MAPLDLSLLLVVVLLVGFALVVGLATLADRAAREKAWRQIALERRWDHEHRESGGR